MNSNERDRAQAQIDELSRLLQWMPLYVGDWKRDTAELTATERGILLDLILYYWSNGTLPTNDRAAIVARCTPQELEAALPHLTPVLRRLVLAFLQTAFSPRR
jgi:hypothetical protein